MKADDYLEKNQKAKEVKTFLEGSASPKEKKGKVSTRLKWLASDPYDKYKQQECKELIKSGFIDGAALKSFLDTFSGNVDSMFGGKDAQTEIKKNIVKDAIKELYESGEGERGAKIFNELPKQLQAEIKAAFVVQQKTIGVKIREGKSKGEGTMLGDFLTRVKNFCNLGYIPEADKSDRTKDIEKQKEIGRIIRSSDASVIPKFIRSTLGMTKKNDGRER